MKKVLSILAVVIMLLPLSACAAIVSNDIKTDYLSMADEDDKLYIKSNFSYVYCIDLNNKTFSPVTEGSSNSKTFDWSTSEILKYTFFAGAYETLVPEGYGNIISHIDNCKPANEESVIRAYGQIVDGVLAGYVQIYKDTAGAYGNYSIEKIDYSLLFKYDAKTDEFVVIDTIDDAVVVATQKNKVIYWKNKAYYCYDSGTKSEEFLIQDKAYDSGIQQHSWACVLSDETYCVIHLNKVSGTKAVEYMYVFDYDTGNFFELEYNAELS